MDAVIFSARLSLQVALVSTALVLFIGTGFAFLLSRRRGLWMELLDTALTLPLVLPPTVTGYLLLVLFGSSGLIGRHVHITFTWYAAVLASFTVSLPLMVRTVRAAFESVDDNLVLASQSIGYSMFHTFFRVILPLSKKGVAAGAILAFARALGEFGATLMLAGNIPGRTATMPLAIYSFTAAGEWDKAWWMVLLFTIMSALFLLITGRLTGRRSWALS
jgi:molybdate transport system permease protein